MMAAIRKYLLSGLLVWFPIWVTFMAIKFLIDVLDKTLNLLPSAYRPDHLFGFHIPGIGFIFTLIVLFFTGMVVTNFLGKRLVQLWESVISKIPLVRSIYTGVKKTLETMLSSKGQAFRKVLLIEYPREGLWSIAFKTGDSHHKITDKTGNDIITVFVPTTPNPTSGFMLMVPKRNVHELDMSIDAALKMIISLGVIQPEENNG